MDQLLKAGHARTVFVRGDEVVKRFRHPSPLPRLWDGLRARREFKLLQRAHELGLAVPRPLAIAHTDQGWEVTMEHLRGESLEVLLETATGRKSVGKTAAWRIGDLLAQVGLVGLDHDDLHPGNLLLEPQGEVHLIDLHKARLRRRDDRRLARDLLTLYAPLREALAPGLRLALVQAWCERLSLHPDSVAPRVVDLERRAPPLRRKRVAAGLARWTRPSGMLEREVYSKETVLRRRRGAELAQLAADVAQRIVIRGPREHVLHTWLAAARGFEHRLPGAVPSVLALDAHEPWAWFEVQGSGPISRPEVSDELDRLLADRSLRAEEVLPGRILMDDGSVGLAPFREWDQSD